ncbi:MAG TPA: hypothetical protein PKH33_04300 [bacterium]|nr:hypothetical protein [bacterium]
MSNGTCGKSYLERDSLYNELAMVMMQKFKGNNYRIPVQSNENFWHPTFDSKWLETVGKHLRYQKTIGIYPIDERGTVATMAIDIDRHNDSVTEYELVHDKLLPLIKYYTDLGVKNDQILVENSGAGFHLWFWSDKPVAAEVVTTFLAAVKYEYVVEIFPNNPTPDGLGNLIRLPLGVHRKRYHEKKDGAKSHLCVISDNQVQPVYEIQESLELLRAWQPLSMRQFNDCDLDKKHQHDIFSTEPVGEVSASLIQIRNNETRACFKMILSNKTKDGERNDMAFWLGLYFKNIMKVDAAGLQSLMIDWNNSLTEPKLTWKEIDNTCKSVLRYNGWPTCKKGKHKQVCIKYNLCQDCEYDKNRRSSLPVADKDRYIVLKKKISALYKIELALYHLRSYKGPHPERGDGWMKTTYDELAKEAGISKFTIQNKRQYNPYSGMTPLQVLKMQGIIDYEANKGSKYLWIRILK